MMDYVHLIMTSRSRTGRKRRNDLPYCKPTNPNREYVIEPTLSCVGNLFIFKFGYRVLVVIFAEM